jgi:hypothetical protein
LLSFAPNNMQEVFEPMWKKLFRLGSQGEGAPGLTRAASREDRVWLSTSGKLRGLARFATGRCATQPILVLAYFEETVQLAAQALASEALQHRAFECHPPLGGATAVEEWLRYAHAGQVAVASAWDLPEKAWVQHGAAAGQDAKLIALFAERHPRRTIDDDCAARFVAPAEVTFFLAVDEPLFQRATQASAEGSGVDFAHLLEKLGFTDSEAISNSMVDRVIRSAQEHLAASPGGDQPARSQAEWFERNAP